MSETYASQRVQDALKQSDDSLPKAQRLLLSWLANDEKLLYALAAPHLRSLVGYALQQEFARQEEEGHLDDAPILPTDVEDDAETMGMEILQTMAGETRPENFGFVSEDVAAPQKTSDEHVAAILKIAKKEE